MKNKVYNFKLAIDWKLINLISEIDRFDANWTAIERKTIFGGYLVKQKEA